MIDRLFLSGELPSRLSNDVDILAIGESSVPRYSRARPLYRALASIPVDVDIIVYTPDEVADWSQVPQAFVTRAIREGRVLYENAGNGLAAAEMLLDQAVKLDAKTLHDFVVVRLDQNDV